MHVAAVGGLGGVDVGVGVDPDDGDVFVGSVWVVEGSVSVIYHLPTKKKAGGVL